MQAAATRARPQAIPVGTMKLGGGMTTILHVCTTCRAGQPVPEGQDCPGQRLHQALTAANEDAMITIRAVECLSACDNGCSVALTKPGAWSYIYGRMTTDDVAEILRGAALYAASSNGVVPWRERPTIFRKQSLARLPPLES